jgi:hypothetical protein
MALLILPDKKDAKGEWQVEFRVIWEIEIEADSPNEAAQEARVIQSALEIRTNCGAARPSWTTP